MHKNVVERTYKLVKQDREFWETYQSILPNIDCVLFTYTNHANEIMLSAEMLSQVYPDIKMEVVFWQESDWLYLRYFLPETCKITHLPDQESLSQYISKRANEERTLVITGEPEEDLMVLDLNAYFEACFENIDSEKVDKVIVPLRIDNLYLVPLIKKLKGVHLGLHFEVVYSNCPAIQEYIKEIEPYCIEIKEMTEPEIAEYLKNSTSISAADINAVILGPVFKEFDKLMTELNYGIHFASQNGLNSIYAEFSRSGLSMQDFKKAARRYIKDAKKQNK